MANGIIQYIANIIDDLNVSDKSTYSSEKIESLKHIKEYKRDTKYREDTLVYFDNKLYRVFMDFTSAKAIDFATDEDALEEDVKINKNLILVSADIPDKHEEQVSFDGVAKTFDLLAVLKNDNQEVYINGLRQVKDIDYTIDRTILPNTITFDIVYDTFDKCLLIY